MAKKQKAPLRAALPKSKQVVDRRKLTNLPSVEKKSKQVADRRKLIDLTKFLKKSKQAVEHWKLIDLARSVMLLIETWIRHHDN